MRCYLKLILTVLHKVSFPGCQRMAIPASLPVRGHYIIADLNVQPLKSDSQLPKNIVLFTSMKAL